MEIKTMVSIKQIAAVFVLLISVSAFAKTDTSIIIKRKIFADDVPPPPPQKPVVSILKPVEPPSIDKIINLKGIVFSPTPGESRAIIENLVKKGESVYSESDIVENARIMKIQISSVVFEYCGKQVELSLQNKAMPQGAVFIPGTPVAAAGIPSASSSMSAASGSAIPVSTRTPPVPEIAGARDVDFAKTMEALRDDKELFAAVGISPYIENGTVSGFTVSRIPADSIPAQMGLRDGDVIRRVNGVLIDSLARGISVYQDIVKSQTKLVTVEVLRQGKPVILSYRLN